jgi:hypothetical protein
VHCIAAFDTANKGGFARDNNCLHTGEPEIFSAWIVSFLALPMRWDKGQNIGLSFFAARDEKTTVGAGGRREK